MRRHSPQEIADRVERTLGNFAAEAAHQIGYPANQQHDYSDLLQFLAHSANNIGDPFQDSNFRINTHDIEREVIADFADLMRLEPQEAWGYVTSGGTEGNMYGLFIARETHPEGTVYFSQDTHYSVLKLLRLLNMQGITVRGQPNGEMDYADLRENLHLNSDSPAIIVANIGTTMKGAVDNLDAIKQVLTDTGVQECYIHADAALSGMILPFVPNPQPHGFDAGIDSIAVSGHKLMGAPVPCGIVLTRKSSVARIARAIEYVGIMDTTISGSRSAIAPLMIWQTLRRNGTEGFRELAAGMMDTAQYAVEQFNDSGIPAWRNPNSATVVFPRPGAEVFRKWQVATLDDIAHIINMPHVTRDMVDEFVHDCLRWAE